MPLGPGGSRASMTLALAGSLESYGASNPAPIAAATISSVEAAATSATGERMKSCTRSPSHQRGAARCVVACKLTTRFAQASYRLARVDRLRRRGDLKQD